MKQALCQQLPPGEAVALFRQGSRDSFVFELFQGCCLQSSDVSDVSQSRRLSLLVRLQFLWLNSSLEEWMGFKKYELALPFTRD